MKNWKSWTLPQLGTLDIFSLAFIGLIVLSIFNSIAFIAGDRPLWQLSLYVAPYIVVAIFSLYCKRRQWGAFNALVCLSASYIMFFTTGPNEYSGMAFLIFAIHIIKNKRIKAAIIAAQYIAIVFINTIRAHDLNNLLTMIFIYTFAFLIYFNLTVRHDPSIIIPDVQNVDKEILCLVIKGENNKEIGYTLSLSPSAVSHRLARLREKFNVGNNEELVYNLAIKGYLRQ